MPNKEEKSIYERYRENTIITILSTSLCIVFVLIAYNSITKCDVEKSKRIYIEQKYELLEDEYLHLQTIYKECIADE